MIKWLGLMIMLAAGSPVLANGTIVVQSTTSTANSGLYNHLLPQFEAATGIVVHVVAVGTGQAIKNAANCDGDVLLVHAKSAEEKFVADGFGTARFDVMYNDFVIVGPQDDPAGIAMARSATQALAMLAKGSRPFASRGDDSGTHRREMVLWKAAGINPTSASGDWYLETGSGMGATLNVALGLNAYTLTDRATWISFRQKSNHTVLVEGGAELINQYGVIVVDSAHCASANTKDGQIFVHWLLSRDGQNAIASFQIDGQQLFFPNAGS